MQRLRLLVVLVASTFIVGGLHVSSATAAVDVSNPGQAELSGRMAIEVTQGSNSETYACHTDLTMDVSDDGVITVTDVTPTWDQTVNQWYCHPSGYEAWLNDCDDAGWTGQILGPGDQWERGDQVVEYAGTGDFEAVMDACTKWSRDAVSSDPGNPIIRFAIDEVAQGSESWSLPEQPLYSWIPEAAFITTYGQGFDYPLTSLGIDSE